MRIILVAGFAVCCLAPAAQAGDGASWCYRDFSGPPFSNCGYSSARQCLAFAGIVGGVCERGPGAPARPAVARKQVKR
jgi:hypothetical protein